SGGVSLSELSAGQPRHSGPRPLSTAFPLQFGRGDTRKETSLSKLTRLASERHHRLPRDALSQRNLSRRDGGSRVYRQGTRATISCCRRRQHGSEELAHRLTVEQHLSTDDLRLYGEVASARSQDTAIGQALELRVGEFFRN